MANDTPKKPGKNHPWRNSVSHKAASWAKEQSNIRNVTNVTVARATTLERHISTFGGQV